MPITRAHTDEIAAAPMIWPEDETMVAESRESCRDVVPLELRTIPSDHNDPVVSQLRDGLDCVFQTFRKRMTNLWVDVCVPVAGDARSREDMNIGSRGVSRQTLLEKTLHALRQMALRQIHTELIHENQDSSTQHHFRSGRERFYFRFRRELHPGAELSASDTAMGCKEARVCPFESQ